MDNFRISKTFRGMRPVDKDGRDGLANPERGFRFEIGVGRIPSDMVKFAHVRDQWPFLRYKRDGVVISQAYCYLTQFHSSAISDEMLAALQADFDRARCKGVKFLLRFAAFPKLKICGCASSGKTLLATEKARLLADCGKRTLVLCYNKLIASKIAKNFHPSMPVTVAAFYDFGIDALGLSRKQVAQHEKDARAYRIIAQFLKDHIAAGKIKPYDAIVVDEAQDFTDEMWGIVNQLLTDDSRRSQPESHLNWRRSRCKRLPHCGREFRWGDQLPRLHEVQGLRQQSHHPARRGRARQALGPRRHLHRPLPRHLPGLHTPQARHRQQLAAFGFQLLACH